MNKFIIFLLSFFIFSNLKAQVSPDGIVFQAVAKDLNYIAATNRNVYAIVNILEGSTTGNNSYSEYFQVFSTNEGVFSITIGKGRRLSGAASIANLDWLKKSYFFNIKIAIEPTLMDPSWSPDNNYVDLGTTQFWSVPYSFTSLNSKFSDSSYTITSILSSAKGGTGVDNKDKTLSLGNNLITKGVGNLTITTTAASNIVLPTSGLLANTSFVQDQIGKDTVSLSNRINNKLDSSQFPTLITPYLKSISGMKYSDTTSMLSTRFARDTVSLSDRINLKLNFSDTSSMLSSRFARDTSSLSDRIDNKLNSTDTALMLATYARKFTKNITLNIASGKSLGKYQNGATIPAAGKTLDEFLFDISTETIPPTYTSPTVRLNPNTNQTVEIGTDPGIILLRNVYTQNDGGAVITTTYFKNDVSLGSASTNAPGSILSNLTYKVNVAYAQGPVKNDNLGNPDPTGRIAAGTITSGYITYIPQSKKYWGSSTNQTINFSLLPNTNEFYITPAKSTFSINITGSQYVYYAYPSSGPDLSSISVGGFESINSFTKSIIDITNAQGYTLSYKLYVSNNNFSQNVTNIIIQ
jgi:hypothetical protein